MDCFTEFTLSTFALLSVNSLDPTATARIEELIEDLEKIYTIVIVTHNMQQAARISDYTGFLLHGQLIEYNITTEVFTTPEKRLQKNTLPGDSDNSLWKDILICN